MRDAYAACEQLEQLARSAYGRDRRLRNRLCSLSHLQRGARRRPEDRPQLHRGARPRRARRARSLAAILGVGRALSLDVVAEGIEKRPAAGNDHGPRLPNGTGVPARPPGRRRADRPTALAASDAGAVGIAPSSAEPTGLRASFRSSRGRGRGIVQYVGGLCYPPADRPTYPGRENVLITHRSRTRRTLDRRRSSSWSRYAARPRSETRKAPRDNRPRAHPEIEAT